MRHLHYYVEDNGQRCHAGVEGHGWQALAPGDGGVPLFRGRLAEVRLHDQEAEVKEYACDYYGDGSVARRALWHDT